MPRLSRADRAGAGPPLRRMPEPCGACPRTAGSRQSERPAPAHGTPPMPDLRLSHGPGPLSPGWSMDFLLRHGLSLLYLLPPHCPLRSSLPMLALRALYLHRPTPGPFVASDPERYTLPELRRSPKRSNSPAIGQKPPPEWFT